MANEQNRSVQKINHFNQARHGTFDGLEKDLALSISLEANELLEIFQWKSSAEAIELESEHLEEELADVLIYSYILAEQLGLNIDTIIEKKLEKNQKKYPLPTKN